MNFDEIEMTIYDVRHQLLEMSGNIKAEIVIAKRTAKREARAAHVAAKLELQLVCDNRDDLWVALRDMVLAVREAHEGETLGQSYYRVQRSGDKAAQLVQVRKDEG